MKTEIIKVKNIHCGGCKRNIETAISQIEGVQIVNADIDTRMVTIAYNGNEELLQEFRETLEEWGFPEDK
jgi:copper chaperone CopZ